jgi:hypothetical protein
MKVAESDGETTAIIKKYLNGKNFRKSSKLINDAICFIHTVQQVAPMVNL